MVFVRKQATEEAWPALCRVSQGEQQRPLHVHLVRESHFQAATLSALSGCTSRPLFQKEETGKHVEAGLDLLAQCQEAAPGVFNSGVTSVFQCYECYIMHISDLLC